LEAAYRLDVATVVRALAQQSQDTAVCRFLWRRDAHLT
jgi:hypothetical protein